jgi:ubiquinone/menaquinone biosynthesis C-methylase UbiE
LIAPISFRKNIPLFYNKTEEEIRKDQYERYDPMVIRQSALHLFDELWAGYPMQEVLDFAQEHWPKSEVKNVVELGCSVGRWIAEITETNPKANCWGIDYSYQLLRQASDIWIHGKVDNLDFSRIGFPNNYRIEKKPLQNLRFGLAKAEKLPFDDESQDMVLSSFLFDRLQDPIQGVLEMKRVLKKGGKMIMVTPLNFIKSEHWKQFDPPVKLYHQLTDLGLEVLDWREDMIIKEPLDARGNEIVWRCIAVVATKS